MMQDQDDAGFIIASRLNKNEKEIDHLSSRILNLTKQVEDYKQMQDKSIKLIYVWLAFSVALVIASIIMTQLGASLLKAIEIVSSWGACLFLIIGGLHAAKITYSIDKFTGYIVAASWALISTCYVGYVLLNFGSLHPYAGAIGFNLGASAQTLALIAIARILKKNG